MEIRCPACGKILTPADHDEKCPESLYAHGLHPIVVMNLSEISADFVSTEPPQFEFWIDYAAPQS